MKRGIWKFELILDGYVKATPTCIQMPKGAEPLDVQVQAHPGTAPIIALWALVDPAESEREERTFVIVGSGYVGVDERMVYITTFQTGLYAWHVFEVVESE